MPNSRFASPSGVRFLKEDDKAGGNEVAVKSISNLRLVNVALSARGGYNKNKKVAPIALAPDSNIAASTRVASVNLPPLGRNRAVIENNRADAS